MSEPPSPLAALPPALRKAHHALRQPLNAIGLFGQALRLQGADAAQLQALQGLLGSVEALERELDAFFAELSREALGGAGAAALVEAPNQVREPEAPWGLHAAPAAPAKAPLLPVAPDRGRTEPALCAVIDDDAAARLGLSMLLEAWGLDVQAFAGLAQAERAWRDGEPRAPDVLIADYHLPRPADGLVAIARCRALWPQRQIPALVLTGDTSVCTDTPATQVLFKPVAPLVLRQGIDQALERGA